jgi:hypothetical protein
MTANAAVKRKKRERRSSISRLSRRSRNPDLRPPFDTACGTDCGMDWETG